jgi:hypothetical protein
MSEVARVHDADYKGENRTEQEWKQILAERDREEYLAALKLQKERSKNASVPHIIHLSPRDSLGRRCYYSAGPNTFLKVSRAENTTAEVRVQHSLRNDRFKGVLVKMGIEKMHEAVDFQLIDDYIRDDAGAIIFRVYKGSSPNFTRAQNESWKLRTINGAPATHQDWRTMIRETLRMGDTSVVFEGPIACNPGFNKSDIHHKHSPPCHANCSRFIFQPDAGLSWDGAPAGILVEQSTKQCFGRITKSRWVFWSTDLGAGLVDCNSAPKYRYHMESFRSRIRFCNVNPPHDCQRILLDLNFKHRTWVPFKKGRPTMLGAMEQPRHVVQQLRTMIALFWNCKDCRKHFDHLDVQSVENIHHPRDAVLWWWRVHNDINARLKTAADYTPVSPYDPEYPKTQWPPRSLCPECWSDGSFNEKAVYLFLIDKFYAPEQPAKSGLPGAAQQEWIPVEFVDGAHRFRSERFSFIVSLFCCTAFMALIALAAIARMSSQSYQSRSWTPSQAWNYVYSTREVSFSARQQPPSAHSHYTQCATTCPDRVLM